MTETYTGTIKKVFEKGGRHSFLMDDDNWYGLGYKAFNGAANGAKAKFDFSFDNSGRYRNVVFSSIKVKEGEPTQSSGYKKKASGGPSDYAAKDTYWKDKESRDIDTQKRISYQAAMNTAITLVNSALDHKFMTAPSGKVADKHGAYMAMVYEQADELFRAYQNLPDNADSILASGAVEETVDVVEGMQAEQQQPEPVQEDDDDNDDWD